jgi:hypothetical protein
MNAGRSLGGFVGRAAGWLAVSLGVACAHDKPLPPPDVPPALAIPGSAKLTHMLHGTGVQIYECTAGAQNAPRYGWVLQGPKADLSDRSGKDIGRHYEGPTWEAYDGSKVVGEVTAHADSPGASAPGGANAVPWLLLRATTNVGKGIFAKVQWIQRLHTIGGLPPQSACDAAHAGQRVRVAYSADYYFYVPRR